MISKGEAFLIFVIRLAATQLDGLLTRSTIKKKKLLYIRLSTLFCNVEDIQIHSETSESITAIGK